MKLMRTNQEAARRGRRHNDRVKTSTTFLIKKLKKDMNGFEGSFEEFLRSKEVNDEIARLVSQLRQKGTKITRREFKNRCASELKSLFYVVSYLHEVVDVSTGLSNPSKGEGRRRFGEFLLYLFLDLDTAEAVSGDLEEGYQKVLKKFGERKAKIWCTKQVYSSLWPVFVAWTKKLNLLSVLFGLIRRG